MISETQLPLSGLRVVELASWIMAPTSTALMAMFGADVIKIEPADSADPLRGSQHIIDENPIELGFEMANAGKRSIQANVSTATGKQIVEKLLASADIFVTNVRTTSLARLGLLPEDVHRRFPKLIVAHATGYGNAGPDRDRPAFDELGYWSRAGIARTLAAGSARPVPLYGAMGDLPSAVALFAGVLLALHRRERAGVGSIVDASLYSAGMWMNGWGLQEVLAGVKTHRDDGTRKIVNPLYQAYECEGGKWLQLAMFQTDRYWASFCTTINRQDLIAAEAFSSHAVRCQNGRQAVEEIQASIQMKPIEYWGPKFDAEDFPWSPIFTMEDVASDPQARENRYIVSKTHRSGVQLETVAPPFRIRGLDELIESAPELGQHTEEVLLTLGLSWEEIAQATSS